MSRSHRFRSACWFAVLFCPHSELHQTYFILAEHLDREPFWSKIPMGFSPLRRALAKGKAQSHASKSEGYLWYCHLNGQVSETGPKQVTAPQ